MAVGDPYGCAKFGANPSMGASGQIGSAFFVKEYFPVPSSGGNQYKSRHAPIWHLANHKIKMCHNSMKKNNDTKDYSEQIKFLNSEPYYASKKNC